MTDALIVTTREAAELAGIAEATIWKWIERGWIKPTNPGHKPLRFNYDDIARVQRDHRPKSWLNRHQALRKRWLAGYRHSDLS
ncbi:helix-turn-helix domain-containing protein [Nocardioides nitrophenolicus]|uniref:helix-turn-helix domain-containing protein n=1 Tax=Nocardioides nitrophenolicus TaxID=60489 RepID=UPI000B2D17AF|nr:helix-turn-helix domain-containing protein [Nocardioides nitrophenolicus]MBM7518287.1 excisionase family DNA binding protein [Nocardioides nitrophenolicus]